MDDIENLKTDFYRFAKLHSWYKHLRLEGSTFVFFKQNEQQVRYDFDKCLTNESRTEFWHFVELNCWSKYLKELSEKGVVMYQAKFGPFLRGVEHGTYFHGFHIINNRNTGLIEYLKNKYTDFTDNYSAEMINKIATSEQNEYLENMLQFNVYSPSN